jgi:hypothetical protein
MQTSDILNVYLTLQGMGTRSRIKFFEFLLSFRSRQSEESLNKDNISFGY